MQAWSKSINTMVILWDNTNNQKICNFWQNCGCECYAVSSTKMRARRCLKSNYRSCLSVYHCHGYVSGAVPQRDRTFWGSSISQNNFQTTGFSFQTVCLRTKQKTSWARDLAERPNIFLPHYTKHVVTTAIQKPVYFCLFHKSQIPARL